LFAQMTAPTTKARRNIMLVSDVAELGGAERSLLDIAETMKLVGVEPRIVVPRSGGLSRELERSGLQTYFCPHLSRLRRRRSLPVWFEQAKRSVAAATAVGRLVSKVGADVVHANTVSAALQVLSVPGAVQVPVVTHVRDLKVGAERYWLTRHSSGFVFASNACAAGLRSRIGRELPFAVIPSGVRSVPSEANLQSGTATPIIAAIAHFAPWKRHDVLIEAVRLVHRQGIRVSLEIAGGDPFGNHPHIAQQLQRQVVAAGLAPWVRFLGDIPDVSGLLRRARCLVHTAYPEPFGRVIVEALRHGCPIVAAAGEHGPAEILADGVGGKLVPPDTPSAFAAEIAALVTYPEQAQRLASGAQRKFEQRYRCEHVTESILAFYERV